MPSAKRLIRQACVQVLEDPKIHPREKMKAAGILERLTRMKASARARKAKNAAHILADSSQSDTPAGRIAAIIEAIQ
jgi:hypothetical protein